MSMRFEKTYPYGYMKRDLSCSEYKVDDTHTVMILRRDKTYESYVHEKAPGEPLGTPFLFMFGTDEGSMSYSEIVDMTITVAPSYYDLFVK